MLWCLSVQAQGMAVMRCSQLAVWHQRQLPAAASGTGSSPAVAAAAAAANSSTTSTDSSNTASFASSTAAAAAAAYSAATGLYTAAEPASTSTGGTPAVPAALVNNTVTNSITNKGPISFFKTLLGDIQGHSLYKAIQDGMQQQAAAWACTHCSGGQLPSVGILLQGLTAQQLLPLLRVRRLQRATSFAASFRCAHPADCRRGL
jgi:hypothetical protein